MAEKVLLIDDDVSLRRVVEFTLQEAGYQVLTATNGEDGLRIFRQSRPALVITDVQMPGISGYQVLEQVVQSDPQALVIIVTAFSTVEQAVGAMKSGAYDYLTKPFSRDQLRVTVSKAFEFRGLKQENVRLKDALAEKNSDADQIIGKSPRMLQLMERVERVAASQASVLLTGESGTGKEVIARALHQGSQRTDGPFVAVNCAAIPKDLMESELFGHLKGSFTGALKDRQGKFSQASGGTLFLDEIGELPLDLQPKLLRSLQEQVIEPVGGGPEHIDVRVVAATNRDLEQAMQDGQFREDLYYRLAVVPIELPPLRERREDIPLLFDFFMKKHRADAGITVAVDVFETLADYQWPGNVRELENVVEQMLILRQSDQLCAKDLPLRIGRSAPAVSGVLNLPKEGYSLETLEREAVEQALAYCQGNKTRAAAFLQVPRHTLLYRLEKYSIK
ncbi:MAG TPA: sigma-54 dependent transcriptional regulator [Geopsychrobacteraceae bacterium]|nr:sigma-54 dependent transcriptional regulator [Geopsychrobacteraceae bacterium]